MECILCLAINKKWSTSPNKVILHSLAQCLPLICYNHILLPTSDINVRSVLPKIDLQKLVNQFLNCKDPFFNGSPSHVAIPSKHCSDVLAKVESILISRLSTSEQGMGELGLSWHVNFYTSFKYQAYPSLYGNYGLEPVWLPLRSNACSTYLFSTKIHAKLQPNCQCKWSSSLLLIIISFLLCLIVNSLFIIICRLPWPWDVHLLERGQYRESLGNAPFWR